MKRILLLMLLTTFIITGCEKEKDQFEHYSLKDKDLNSYTYYSDERGEELYVLADITPNYYESILTGLFYKVGTNDYILLETLEFNQRDAYKKDYVYQFYGNKLYGVGNGNTAMIFEIELKGKNSEFKELQYEYNGTINPFFVSSIKEMKNDNILYSGYSDENGHTIYVKITCSLSKYKCSVIEKY